LLGIRLYSSCVLTSSWRQTARGYTPHFDNDKAGICGTNNEKKIASAEQKPWRQEFPTTNLLAVNGLP
jgi:hypothetical protein